MWALLQLHAKQCQESNCPVPRCRELRNVRMRQAARQEAQRRSGYQNMLRKQQHELQAR
jgi:E1A/CREB-binding protein